MEEMVDKMVDLEVKMEENQGDTMADVRWFNGTTSNSSGVAAAAAAGVDITIVKDEPDRNMPRHVQFLKNAMYYDMTGEKELIILSHHKYQKTKYFEYRRPSERNGTDKDETCLKKSFGNLGFRTMVYRDLQHGEILKVMSEVCKKDHRPTSCIAVAIMTHGDGDGTVYAADRPYRLNDITSILQNSDLGLVGKPKLLFVQACRGASMDEGRRVQTDGGERIVLPTHADTLIMYSSAEQYLAYRDSNGSWLMQSLCQVLDEFHDLFDLVQMTTLVHQAVAYRSTHTRSEDTNDKKMMPETKFTLTKLLKF